MKLKDVTKVLDLEEKHYQSKRLKVPVIDSMIYTSLGKQLFDLYEKYKVESADQRKLESLSFLLTSFTLERDKKAGE